MTLLYFYTSGQDFPAVELMREMAQQRGAELVPVADGPASPAFRQRFAEIAGESDPANVEISFCGPKGLLNKVQGQMRENGIPDSNLHHEYFEFR